MLVQLQDCCHVSTPIIISWCYWQQYFTNIDNIDHVTVNNVAKQQRKLIVRPVAVVRGAPHSEDCLIEVPLVSLHHQLQNILVSIRLKPRNTRPHNTRNTPPYNARNTPPFNARNTSPIFKMSHLMGSADHLNVVGSVELKQENFQTRGKIRI